MGGYRRYPGAEVLSETERFTRIRTSGIVCPEPLYRGGLEIDNGECKMHFVFDVASYKVLEALSTGDYVTITARMSESTGEGQIDEIISTAIVWKRPAKS